MPTGPFTADELARYADVAVVRCLDLRPGELLILNYEPEHRPLAIALAEVAYRRGLRVDLWPRDPLIDRAEVLLASDDVLGVMSEWTRLQHLARTADSTGVIFIDGDSEPAALEGTDAARQAARARRRSEQIKDAYERLEAGYEMSLILAYPTEAWAAIVYPDLDAAAAQRALAGDILAFSRLGPDDAPGGETLGAHLDRLDERARTANALRLRSLRFRGPGTDLHVGITEDAIWNCARERNAYGRTYLANLPTEEIYTSPAASLTEGVARCTFPLAHNGRLYEDLELEFRGGRLVRLDTRTDEQRDALAGLLDVDEGGRRLGEVALVDAASRIARSGRLYRDTLMDENQACHMALGVGFGTCRGGGAASPDLNSSRTHIDVMIGSPEVEVTGVTADGATVTLIADGTWQAGAAASTPAR